MRDPTEGTRSTVGPTRGIVVLALGNPILGDDGVGWAVADEVERRLSVGDRGAAEGGTIEVERAAVGGLAVMERLAGAAGAILIDALAADEAAGIGCVAISSLDSMVGRPFAHLDSAHDTTVAAALAAGLSLGIDIPADVTVVTVGIAPSDTFADGLSPLVARAVPRAAEAVLAVAGGMAIRAR